MDIQTTTKQIFTVDYTKTLQHMIAVGNYDWVNVEGTGIVQFEPKVFHFDRDISSEDAVAAIKADDPQNPWEPAKIEHLLAYGAAYPEEQRQYPIIGLTSVAKVRGHRRVPCLYGNDAERDLALSWWDGVWNGDYRFLGVRKQSSAA
jgi:hypothetical protein